MIDASDKVPAALLATVAGHAVIGCAVHTVVAVGVENLAATAASLGDAAAYRSFDPTKPHQFRSTLRLARRPQSASVPPQPRRAYKGVVRPQRRRDLQVLPRQKSPAYDHVGDGFARCPSRVL